MPMEKRHTFWFTDQDNEVFAKIMERLQAQSPIAKIGRADVMRWALQAALEKLEQEPESPRLPRRGKQSAP